MSAREPGLDDEMADDDARIEYARRWDAWHARECDAVENCEKHEPRHDYAYLRGRALLRPSQSAGNEKETD